MNIHFLKRFCAVEATIVRIEFEHLALQIRAVLPLKCFKFRFMSCEKEIEWSALTQFIRCKNTDEVMRSL